ncbi:hypothetical protein MKX08_008842 [Trichoderma sp. CBMAI-0020]|nr:hypothetical protein MKX08_008842 [Trichoderma sp. CBMAI-0020]
MEIDERQYDAGGCLRLVWEPPNVPTTDIIAVHGLYGTYSDTWCNPEDQEGSIGPILEEFSSIARVFAFDSAIYEDILFDRFALEKAATALLEAIATNKNTEEDEKADEAAGQLYMLHKCLSMLSIPELRRIDESSTKRRPFDTLCDLPIASVPHSFAFYAGSCLAIHIRDIEKDSNEAKSRIVQNWLSLFLFSDNLDARSWWIQTFVSCQIYMDVEKDTTEPGAMLRLYALLGFEKTVNWLLCQMTDVISAGVEASVESALWDALRQGHTGTIEILLQPAINFGKSIWAPILEQACQDGNTDLVEKIILRRSEDVKTPSSKEHIIQCLQVVAKYGHWYIIPRIQKACRDLMALMDREILARLIEIASENGRDGVVHELLLVHGHLETYRMETDDISSGATNAQQNEDNIEVDDADLQVHEGSWLSSALVAAARFGSAAIIPLLADHADLEYPSGYLNFTPLHEAALENKTEAMEMLLDCGCDIDCLDDQGATPLMLGCLRGHVRAVQVLLNRGANPDHIATRAAKYRPLHVAARLGNDVLVRILLEAGASENARLKNPAGYTPLHLAVSEFNSSESSHYVQAARTLLEFGADVDATSGNGITPLHMAVKLSQSCEDLIRALIEFGADIDKLDDSGRSALNAVLMPEAKELALKR